MGKLSMTFDSMQADNNNVRAEAENYLKQVNDNHRLDHFYRFKPLEVQVKLSCIWQLILK